MDLYELRVAQLEATGLTTSDAQAIADMETMYGTLSENYNNSLAGLA